MPKPRVYCGFFVYAASGYGNFAQFFSAEKTMKNPDVIYRITKKKYLFWAKCK